MFFDFQNQCVSTPVPNTAQETVLWVPLNPFEYLMMVQLSLVVRKPAFCICENKDADQLRGNHEADQRLCFRYIDSTIPLLSKYEISSL